MLVVVLLAIFLVADRIALARAETGVAEAISAQVQGVGSVESSIDSFPFTGRLALQGEVSTLRMRLRDITGQGIDVAELLVVAHDIELDRRLLLERADVRVTDVGSATATVRITEGAVRRATGVQVDLRSDGTAGVTMGGVTASASAVVEAGLLRLTLEGQPALTVPLPGSSLLPCTPDVRVVADAIVAACEADRLPAIVLDAIGSVELRR